ncbi:hypothetical protein DVR12_07800 [Chitinophaga silvatica]|uniref:Uncharacterized protein n=1 Tax=Chitinophaga silvatica TaxID=2282649 RepID=A0A3E1YF19_9BACT|nr:fasciclin domain-containing protein [Chitinophaga silvatica]RFS25079.1 hypothetical protein DVR12_07800 [Chitinophaga silvatica]
MRKLLPVIGILLIAACFTSSCKKDYYKDGGLANPKYNGSMYQYLEKSNTGLLDTIAYIVQRAGLKEVLEKEDVTFFCPTDQSIYTAMNALNGYRNRYYKDSLTLDQVPPIIWKKFLERYIIEGKHVAKQFARVDPNNIYAYPGINYISRNGFILNIGLIYQDYGGVEAVGARILRVTDINIDPSNFLSNPWVLVASSDIQPTNGVLHVLKIIHTFGFRGDFTDAVEQALINQ